MKNFFLLIAMAALVSIYAFDLAEGEEEGISLGAVNLLKNPGLEDRDVVVGWGHLGGQHSGVLAIVGAPDVEPHSGDNCLSVETMKTDNHPHRTVLYNFAEISAESGSHVKYSFWVKGELKPTQDENEKKRNPSICVTLWYYDEDNKYSGSCWARSVKPASGQWKRSEGSIMLKPDKGKKAVARVLFRIDIMGEGTVYLDDIEFSFKE